MTQPGKRVTRLSRVDRERLAKGEFSYPEEVFRQYDPAPFTPQRSGERSKTPLGEPDNAPVRELPDKEQLGKARRGKRGHRDEPPLTAWEREILANVPPHFGKI